MPASTPGRMRQAISWLRKQAPDSLDATTPAVLRWWCGQQLTPQSWWELAAMVGETLGSVAALGLFGRTFGMQAARAETGLTRTGLPVFVLAGMTAVNQVAQPRPGLPIAVALGRFADTLAGVAAVTCGYPIGAGRALRLGERRALGSAVHACISCEPGASANSPNRGHAWSGGRSSPSRFAPPVHAHCVGVGVGVCACANTCATSKSAG